MRKNFAEEALRKVLEAKMILDRAQDTGAMLISHDMLELISRLDRLRQFLDHLASNFDETPYVAEGIKP